MFSDVLKKLRKERSYTQEQLALLIGVERSSIGKYEAAGVIPSVDILIKIADLFSVPVDYLLERPITSEPIRSVPLLSGKECAIISAYRNNPTMQDAVDRILQVPSEVSDDLVADIVSELRTPTSVQK